MSRKPRNLLVLLCDQLQRDVLDIYGGLVPTRAWTGLAREGVVCDRFYCASPLCVPTRPSMMTGTWPHTHGSVSFGAGYDTIHPGSELLIDRLHDSGYDVCYEGIWHINRPEQDDRRREYAHFKERSFPYAEASRCAEAQGIDPERLRAAVSTPSDTGFVDWTFSVPVPVRWEGKLEDHPDMQAALAVADFIRNRESSRPFAAWLSVGAPHPPILVPEPYYSMFDSADITLPPMCGMSEDGLPLAVSKDAPGWQSVSDWSPSEWQRATAAYLGYVAFADHCMQIVLEAVEDAGIADRTFTLATSDHGEMLGAHNLYQKGVLYDQACRLAAVFRGPELSSGRRCQLLSHTDIAPTILEALGIAPLSHASGSSVWALLKDAGQVGSEYQFVEFNGYISGGIHIRGAISADYKYIYHHHDRDQLFDLVNDPDECRNLVDDPAHAEELASHRSALAGWMRETGDFLDSEWQ